MFKRKINNPNDQNAQQLDTATPAVRYCNTSS